MHQNFFSMVCDQFLDRPYLTTDVSVLNCNQLDKINFLLLQTRLLTILVPKVLLYLLVLAFISDYLFLYSTRYIIGFGLVESSPKSNYNLSKREEHLESVLLCAKFYRAISYTIAWNSWYARTWNTLKQKTIF
jgi:hypothetical protein